jgi:hypothetical protein
MRNARAGLVPAVLLVAACSTAVPGVGRPAEPAMPAPAAATAAPERSPLAADVLPDECLLDAVQLSALLGEAVLPPEQGELVRTDGTRGSSCVADAAGGFPTPLAAINVYAPRTGTPAEFVLAAPPWGRRDLPGVGEAAVLIDTAPGVTMQLAGPRHVVTIAVLDGTPTETAWTTAAAQALAALPSS